MRPVIRAPVHTDAIGALATVRPGIVLSGGRDRVGRFTLFFSFPLIHRTEIYL